MKIFLDALSRIPTVSIGTQALILGSLRILSARFPGATFVMLSSHPEHDASYLRGAGEIEFVPRSPSQWGTLLQLRAIVARVDAVASAWGDGYVSTPPHLLAQKSFTLKRAGVPLLLVTASLGPYHGALAQGIARMSLRVFDGLTVREPNSQRYLEELGLRDVRCLPDTAFALEPAPAPAVEAILAREGVPADTPFIGINPSILLHHRFPQLHGGAYEPVMAAVIAHVRRLTGAPIVLIPHQVYPASFPGGVTDGMRRSYDGDDRVAAELLLAALPDRTGVFAITGEYSPAEYKGLIGRCALFVGGRMHAVISALSCCVPSVLMQYSHKAEGVMRMLDLSGYVWDAKDTPATLLALTEAVWAERTALRAELAQRMPAIVAQAYQVGDVLAEKLV